MTREMSMTTEVDEVPDLPAFLRISREERDAAWAKRPPRPFMAPEEAVARDAERDRVRAEFDEIQRQKTAARIARMRRGIDKKRADLTGCRWDAMKNRWLYEGPLPMTGRRLAQLREAIMNAGLNIDLIDKDFAVMGGPELVRWYNAACEVAQKHQMASYRPVQKFQDKAVAVKRCGMLASSLRAATRPSEEGDQVSPQKTVARAAQTDNNVDDPRPAFLKDKTEGNINPSEQETNVAKNSVKKVKKAKTNGDGKYRIKGKAAGLVADFKPARDGTARAVVIQMAAKGATLEEIGKEIKKPAEYIAVHLYSMNRDNGIGYEVSETGKIKLEFPGSKTVKDAIVTKAAE